MKNLAVLASGRGSNFQAIINHIELGVLQNIKLTMLISNEPTANAVTIARQNQIPFTVIEGIQNRKFGNAENRERARCKFDEKVLEALTNNRIDFVALAGFMQVLGKPIVHNYNYRILNIHPSLDLVRFGGRGMFGDRVHAAVLQAGEKESGCTVHYVDESIDGGPIILQSRVPIESGDDPNTLGHRILVQEHRTYAKALQLHADGRIHITNSCVTLDRSGGWEDEWNERQVTFTMPVKSTVYST
ncbi:MAG TPA: phosphoribosylglycinamide formyltransferase [Candidatus Bathyarchaeia archaeon]|nr:phosphoribosylglycinamide formyltransferase [Candidatus Bathyarchaeia archaeon]